MKYWATVVICDVINMDHEDPTLLGPFDTLQECCDTVAASKDDDALVVSWFMFSLPDGVKPENHYAGVGLR